MYSIPQNAICAALKPVRMTLWEVENKIAAGFPSPAEDFALKCLDLNDLLVSHPLATFFWQVSGCSMVNESICDGDILVVNRALAPRHGHIVVAQVDGQFTVKKLFKRGSLVKLVPANPEFGEITFRDGQELVIVGVVTAAIKQFVQPRSAAEPHRTRDGESVGP
ncbi:translesion error-prone DNA polymerase V autoproteolytic subunit [soil metagenome]